MADGILQNVESAFADAGRVEEVIEAASAELELAKDSAQQLLSSSLPSVEYVQDLATQINNTILPEDVVEEIVGNATASRQAAESALATAQNARYTSIQRAIAVIIHTTATHYTQWGGF